ncbi:DUF1799 domain-containing protein [Glaciimonas sp. PAMC28666]|uniref:DUF1799 domain-containing protein n=1 Tax=Glaciimonas sp. PAMC28666 TaxID=2807626 RepID=UPI00351C64CB
MWPDNVVITNVFIAMSSQWRIGLSGPSGLDYNALPVVMRMSGVRKADHADVFTGVQRMEDAALAYIRAAK